MPCQAVWVLPIKMVSKTSVNIVYCCLDTNMLNIPKPSSYISLHCIKNFLSQTEHRRINVEMTAFMTKVHDWLIAV